MNVMVTFVTPSSLWKIITDEQLIEETLTTFPISALRKGMTMMAPLKEDTTSKILNLGTNPDVLVCKINLLKKVITMRIGDHASIGPRKSETRPPRGMPSVIACQRCAATSYSGADTDQGNLPRS